VSVANALTGSLRELPLADLLAFLAANERTGVVRLDGAVPGLIGMYHGGVTIAMAGDGPTLEQVVVGAGLTTVDGWRYVQGTARGGIGLADALLRRGVNRSRLEAVLWEHSVGALFELVLPSDTWFSFVPDVGHAIGHRFTFDVHHLLAEAERRIAAWRQIAELIPSTALVMRISPESPTDIVSISSDDWRVLAQVDGYRTIADIIEGLGMSAFAVCAVLHRLLLAGVVEIVDDGGWYE